jgi:hypothetical protein
MRSGVLLKATSLLALCVACYGAPAAAAEISLAQPAACTSEEELAFRVERTLGHPIAEAGGPRFLVHIQSTPHGFGARLQLSDESGAASGQRSLVESTCDGLVRALALAIVLAIGSRHEAPASVATATESSAAPTSLPPSEPSAEDTVGTVLSRSDATGPGIVGLAWVVADTGSLPAAGLGVAVGAELVWPSFSLRALGLLLPEREGNVDRTDPASPGAEIGLALGSLLGCLSIATGQHAIQLDACAGWEVGQLAGQGTRVQTPHQNGTLWSAAHIDLSGRWPLLDAGLGVELLIMAAAPLTRDEFILREIGSVYRPASVVGRAGLGLSWTLD